MELSSMLAGEPFTDQPECVCPVIAEFLRTYNDEVDERRRRDLYAYASNAVGTSSGIAGERLRADMVLRWWIGVDRPRLRRARLLMWGLAPGVAARDADVATRAAHFAAASPGRHAAALALLDDLVAVGLPRRRTMPKLDAAVAQAAVRDQGVLGLRATCAQSESPT
ncbi:MAG: hypothetical protein QOI11_2287 [Candidatus Eremiobacteraeota bacterium]|nr:hypothetical protein [Candidatus Eremiobacteraeota bacterium]